MRGRSDFMAGYTREAGARHLSGVSGASVMTTRWGYLVCCVLAVACGSDAQVGIVSTGEDPFRDVPGDGPSALPSLVVTRPPYTTEDTRRYVRVDFTQVRGHDPVAVAATVVES